MEWENPLIRAAYGDERPRPDLSTEEKAILLLLDMMQIHEEGPAVLAARLHAREVERWPDCLPGVAALVQMILRKVEGQHGGRG